MKATLRIEAASQATINAAGKASLANAIAAEAGRLHVAAQGDDALAPITGDRWRKASVASTQADRAYEAALKRYTALQRHDPAMDMPSLHRRVAKLEADNRLLRKCLRQSDKRENKFSTS